MVKHHVLIGLGFKKQNFRNRGLNYMLKRASPVTQFIGGAFGQDRMTIMPVNRPPPPQVGSAVRRPLKFNY